jgi:hypothetical protein
MIQKISSQLRLLFVLALLTAGCSKDAEKIMKDFTIDAGDDIELILPQDWVRLNGVYVGQDRAEISWQMLEGPSSVEVEDEKTLRPKLYGLQPGVYKFELVVTSNGIVKQDTVQILVLAPFEEDTEIGNTEIILEKIGWTYDWYRSLKIDDFGGLVPNGELFELYIMREGTQEWVRVPPVDQKSDSDKYSYEVSKKVGADGWYYDGTLYLYCGDDGIDDNPSVKIIY